MKNMFAKLVASGVVVFALLSLSLNVLAQPTISNVQVLVYGIHYGNQLVYRYQVKNQSSSSIDSVNLGVNSLGKALPGAPWSLDAAYSDVPAVVPQSQCNPFAYMTCSVVVYQFDNMEEPAAKILMRGMELSQSPLPSRFSHVEFIKPGTVSSVAELYVPSKNPGYLTASATVSLFDNFPKDSKGKIIRQAQIPFTKIDVTPPTILGTTTATKDGDMLSVQVNLNVADDYDPSPEVKLASITANEPLKDKDVVASIGIDTRAVKLKRKKGRIYYLTYSALDGSENGSTVTISVLGELEK